MGPQTRDIIRSPKPGGGGGGLVEHGQSTSLSGSDTSPNLYFTFSLLSIRYNETIVNPNRFRPWSGS